MTSHFRLVMLLLDTAELLNDPTIGVVYIPVRHPRLSQSQTPI